MRYQMLETIVLERDLPEHDLKRGDLGTVVRVHGGDAVTVEFVTASGRCRAQVLLPTRDIRRVVGNDLLSVRTIDSAVVT